MIELIRKLEHRNRQAASRLISLVENDESAGKKIMAALKSHPKRAHLVGITGPPGSGKSTLINGLTALLRKKRKKIGVIAVDPSSPLTGGALLGDRIRMREHFEDDGVFIRSMATRIGTGGISRATTAAARILDTLGMDVIFIETTGVGQNEISVNKAVSAVVVVLTPDAGDDIQMMKAGILEIGDIFAVNKGDNGRAERIAHDLEGMIRMQPGRKKPAVVITTASEGKGLDRLLEEIEKYYAPAKR